MKALLSPKVHGYVDYAVVAMLALAPTLFNWSGAPATLCYALAGVQLVMSLLTAYPLGIVKMIPFPLHGGVELVTAPFLVASPWLFGFAEQAGARYFFIISGLALFAVWATTNYRAAERTSGYGQRMHPVGT